MRNLFSASGSLLIGLLALATLRGETPLVPQVSSPSPSPPAPVFRPAPDAGGFGPATSLSAQEPVLSSEVSLTGLGPGVSVAWEPPHAARPPRNLIDQTQEEARAKSAGCMECHRTTDAHSMHSSKYVVLGCTDCHGGDARRGLSIAAGARAAAASGVLAVLGQSAECQRAAEP